MDDLLKENQEPKRLQRSKEDSRRGSAYDAILYGLGIESLTIGALLAKRGRKILIINSEGDSEGLPFLSEEGFLFDTCPSLWLGADEGRPHPALEELAISIDFRLLDPGLQVVLPHHRFSLCQEEPLLEREIRREFPQGQEAIARFFGRMKELQKKMGGFLQRELASPPRDLRTGWGQRRGIPFSLSSIFKEGKPSLLPHLKVLGKDEGSSLLIDALLRGFAGVKSQDCSLLFASTLFTLFREPIYAPLGGAKGLYDALLEAFQRNGGTVCSVSKALHVMRHGRKVGGLATAEGEEFVAHCIVGGLGLWRICRAGMMPEDAERWERRLPRNRTLTLFLGVAEEALPEEMRENLLLVTDSARLPLEENPVWLLLSPPGDETRAPRGKRALSVILSLSSQDQGSDTEVEGRASELMKKLEGFLPFLAGHLSLQRTHLYHSFSMLYPGRRWGFGFGIAPLKQMGYPGPRAFSPQHNLFLIGDLPLYGIGLRAQMDGGYYWANFLAPSKGGVQRES